MKKKIISLTLALVLSLSTAAFAASGTWYLDEYGWWYGYEDGDYAADRWEYLGGEWYHFNAAGYMETGWIWDGGWYYLRQDGSMAVGWTWDGANWYYLYPNGVMATGWALDGENWYYLDASGIMQNGWIKYADSWYYLDQDGVMVTGWAPIDGFWYYMNPDGAMATGWVLDGENWYYLNEYGLMQTGWLKTGGSKYYLNSDGSMATGTQTIDGEEYTFNEDGTCQDDEIVPDYDGFILTEKIAEYAKNLVAKATSSSMTQEEKLWASFQYVANRSIYPYSQNRIPYYKELDWPRVYTEDMMYKGSSDCHGYAALFGYVAVACGYTDVHWAQNGGHAWVVIDGLVYDPVFLNSVSCPTEIFGMTFEAALALNSAIGAGYQYPNGEGTYQYIKAPLF